MQCFECSLLSPWVKLAHGKLLEIYSKIFDTFANVGQQDLLHLVNQNRHSEARVPEMRHFNILITVRYDAYF